MPYIEVKLAKQASRKQERILTEKLGEAITSVPGKTAAGLMVSISSDEHIYKGGEFLEYGAYVNVVFKLFILNFNFIEYFIVEFILLSTFWLTLK